MENVKLYYERTEERSPCMNKIDKIEKELEKAREKAAEWQAKIRDLEKQKQEEENSQIVQAVRLDIPVR